MGSSQGFSRKKLDRAVPSISLKANVAGRGLGVREEVSMEVYSLIVPCLEKPHFANSLRALNVR